MKPVKKIAILLAAALFLLCVSGTTTEAFFGDFSELYRVVYSADGTKETATDLGPLPSGSTTGITSHIIYNTDNFSISNLGGAANNNNSSVAYFAASNSVLNASGYAWIWTSGTTTAQTGSDSAYPGFYNAYGLVIGNYANVAGTLTQVTILANDQNSYESQLDIDDTAYGSMDSWLPNKDGEASLAALTSAASYIDQYLYYYVPVQPGGRGWNPNLTGVAVADIRTFGDGHTELFQIGSVTTTPTTTSTTIPTTAATTAATTTATTAATTTATTSNTTTATTSNTTTATTSNTTTATTSNTTTATTSNTTTATTSNTTTATTSNTTTATTAHTTSVITTTTSIYLLTVDIAGKGIVYSSPSGISCNQTCSANFANSAVTLNAAAANGYLFSGWSSPCSGTGSCSLTLTSSMLVTATFAYTQDFSDVPSTEPYFNYIEAAYRAGIVTGCGNSDYCPSTPITSGQMASFITTGLLTNNFSYPLVPYFIDVPSNYSLFKYIQRFKFDVFTTASVYFYPGSNVTKEKMAAYLTRARQRRLGLNPEIFAYTPTPWFSDVPSTDPNFKYVQYIKDHNITTATNSLNAGANVSRDEMAAYMSRIFLNMP